MNRLLLLAVLLVAFAWTTISSPLEQAPARGGRGGPPPEPSAAGLTVDKVRDNLYVLRGGGGNTAVFITESGVVLVDTKTAGWGRPIIERVRELTALPITTIINTHTHYDHVEGNVEFPPAVEVVTHENTAKLMPEMREIYGTQTPGRNVFKDSGGVGLPRRTFQDRLTLGSGNDRIELHYLGRAHTGGDAFVVFPALRVLHTGDAFPNRGIPIMDANNGGSGVAFPETIGRVAALPDIDTVITGHNATTVTMADVAQYAEFNRVFVEAVRVARQAGQSIEDVANNWRVPEQFLKAGYAQPPVARLRSNVEVVWKELN